MFFTLNHTFVETRTVEHDTKIGFCPASNGLVFPGPLGKPMSYATAWRALQATCDSAGLSRTGWHLLRHTFASELVIKGAPIRAVQILLGHCTIQMTERYSHLAPPTLHDVVGMLGTSNPGIAPHEFWATGGQRGK